MALSFDAAANLAKVTVSTGYNSSDTTIVLAAGNGARLPAPPFNATWFNATDYPDPADDPNVELVRVTSVATDTLTVTRAQEGTAASTKNAVNKTYLMVAGLSARSYSALTASLVNDDTWIGTLTTGLAAVQVTANGASSMAVAAGNSASLAIVNIGTLNTEVNNTLSWIGTLNGNTAFPNDASARAGVAQAMVIASEGTSGVNQVLPIAVAGTTVANLDAAWIGTLSTMAGLDTNWIGTLNVNTANPIDLSARNGVTQVMLIATSGTAGVNQVLPIAVAGTTVANLDAVWIGTINGTVSTIAQVAYSGSTIANSGSNLAYIALLDCGGTNTDSTPRVPTAYDDEFSDNNLGGKWTLYNNPGYSEINSIGVMQAGSVGLAVRGIIESRPTAPYEVQAKFTLSPGNPVNMTSQPGIPTAQGIGLLLRDSASNKVVSETMAYSLSSIPFVGTWAMNTLYWTSGTNRTMSAGTLAVSPNPGAIYMRLRDDGTNFNFYWSNDGGGWSPMPVVNRLAWLPSTYDQMGAGIYQAGTNVIGSVDWFRRTL